MTQVIIGQVISTGSSDPVCLEATPPVLIKLPKLCLPAWNDDSGQHDVLDISGSSSFAWNLAPPASGTVVHPMDVANIRNRHQPMRVPTARRLRRR
ncbi:MAG: hypothetical protein H6669_05440 [Ardenticatenaceae bacterium]|nr:hypothetical protein [Ardenticatenaceae bacterium]